MHDVLNQIVNSVTSVPASVWAVIGAALGISAIVQTIKHKIGDDLSDKTLAGILTALSAAAASTDYLLGQAAQNPTVLGSHTAELVGLATLGYRFVIKPVYNLIVDAKAYRDANTTQKPTASTTNETPTEFAA